MRRGLLLTATALFFAFPSAAVAAVKAKGEFIGSKVRSDRWNVKRGASRIEELSGNVTYTKGKRFLRADWALFNHSTRILKSRGRIRARYEFESGERTSLKAERGVYDMGAERGTLRGRDDSDPIRFYLTSETPGESGEGKARLLRWDAARETASLEGDVRFHGERGEARAERADYAHAAGRLTLSGRRPVLKSVEPEWSAAVQADRIRAFRGMGTTRRVLADGTVHGWLHFKDKEAYGTGTP